MQEKLKHPKVCERMRNILLYLNMDTILDVGVLITERLLYCIESA